MFGRPGNNPFCHSRALAMAARGIAETLEPVAAAPGEPFDFGRFRIVETELDQVENDPLIGMTMVSKVFGLKPGLAGLWSPDELATALALR
jgi:hypothetical protein